MWNGVVYHSSEEKKRGEEFSFDEIERTEESYNEVWKEEEWRRRRREGDGG